MQQQSLLEKRKAALKPFVQCAQLYVGFSCLLGVICCIWTVAHYMKEDPVWTFGIVGMIFSLLLFTAVLLEFAKHKRKESTDGVQRSSMARRALLACTLCEVNEIGMRLAHITASFISIFSVCVATGNIINWYDQCNDTAQTSLGLFVLSVATIVIQWLFCVLCVPYNGITLCFVNTSVDSLVNALHEQYVTNGCYFLASKHETYVEA